MNTSPLWDCSSVCTWLVLWLVYYHSFHLPHSTLMYLMHTVHFCGLCICFVCAVEQGTWPQISMRPNPKCICDKRCLTHIVHAVWQSSSGDNTQSRRPASHSSNAKHGASSAFQGGNDPCSNGRGDSLYL